MRDVKLRNLGKTMSAVAVCLCLAGAAMAAPPPAGFTYQGQLVQGAQPVTGTKPMVFRLFNVASGGSALSTQGPVNVPVANGLFTASINPPAGTINGSQAIWLEVEVEGTPLLPRQLLTGSPYSLSTRGITVDAQNRVGIGTATPQSQLHVIGGAAIFDGSGAGVFLATNELAISEAESEDTVYRFEGGLGGRHTWSNGGAPVLTLFQGRMGLGTTAPSAPLEVAAAPGNASVKLPDDSIGPAEMFAEPGVAATRVLTTVDLGGFNSGSWKTIASVDIVCPTAGYLIVSGYGMSDLNAQLFMRCNLNGVFETNGEPLMTRGFGSGDTQLIINRVIPVSAGPNNVTWIGRLNNGLGNCMIEDPYLSVVFVPTAYGTVNMSATP